MMIKLDNIDLWHDTIAAMTRRNICFVATVSNGEFFIEITGY